jgi:hypothetical protein
VVTAFFAVAAFPIPMAGWVRLRREAGQILIVEKFKLSPTVGWGSQRFCFLDERYMPTLPTFAHLCPPLPTIAHHCQPLPTFAHHCPPLPTFAYLCPPLPTFAHLCPLSHRFQVGKEGTRPDEAAARDDSSQC